MNTQKHDRNKFHAIAFMLRFLDVHYSSKIVRCHIDLHRDLILHQSENPHDPEYEFVVAADVPENHFSPDTIFNDFLWQSEGSPNIPFARFQEAASLRTSHAIQHGTTLTVKEKDDILTVFRAGISLMRSSNVKKGREQAERMNLLLPKLHYTLFTRIDQHS